MTILKTISENNADRIVGDWMSTENNMAVEIYKASHFYEAKVIWVDNSNDKSTPMMQNATPGTLTKLCEKEKSSAW